MRALLAIARADFLERVRTYAYLVTLAAVLWLGYGTYSGLVTVSLDDHRGTLNSAWVGGMMALVVNTVLPLAGFYVVKNTVVRDEKTGVGQILATTPMTRATYTLGKALSNLALLGTIVAILALVAVALQIVGAEDARFDPVALLTPFVFVVLPAMALVAALAVLFETVPFLAGGFGNVMWMVLWAAGLAFVVETATGPADPTGMKVLIESMQQTARTQLPAYSGSFSINIEPQPAAAAGFTWNGVAWTSGFVLSRVVWLAAAVAIAFGAALPFHRFDPARVRFAWRKRARKGDRDPSAAAITGRRERTPLRVPLPGGLVGAELRLLIGGIPRMWLLVALGLWIASAFTPLAVARSALLPALWLWPILAWSGMGCREARYGTGGFLFSSPGALTRQLPAAFFAGVVLSIALGGALGVRLLLAGEFTGFVAWCAGALFAPAMALALGLWSGSGKLFEALYLCLWYVGPAGRAAPLDFMGATLAGKAPHDGPAQPAFWIGATAALLAASVVGRLRQLRG